MQWCGSTNKSPTKLNATEIKFDTVICLRMGKTTKAKTLLGDFKITTPKNSLINNQVITNKMNLMSFAPSIISLLVTNFHAIMSLSPMIFTSIILLPGLIAH